MKVISTDAFWRETFSNWIWRRGDLGHHAEVWGGNSRSQVLCMRKHAFHICWVWAAMRAYRFNVSVGSDGQSHKTVPRNHNFRRERRAEAISNRGPSAYQPIALPLGQTGFRWLKTGLTVDKQIYGAAKRAVTNIVHKAKSHYFSSQIAQGNSCKELFGVCNELRGCNSDLPLPAALPVIFLTHLLTISSGKSKQSAVI